MLNCRYEAKETGLSILLCLTPDNFTRQWGTPGSQWVDHSLKNYVPVNGDINSELLTHSLPGVPH